MDDYRPLPNSLITQVLANSRKRPGYVVELLKFQLGREPTQEEVDAIKHSYETDRLAHRLWLEMQPWAIRKRHVSTEDRVRRILKDRYNVPDSLVEMLINECTNDW